MNTEFCEKASTQAPRDTRYHFSHYRIISQQPPEARRRDAGAH